jgi:hypothetical protein
MPVAVPDASAATVIYDVSLAAARRLAPPGFEVIEAQPGRAQFVLAGVSLQLGDHPLAAELAGLGLPAEPVSSIRIERMQGSFEEPQPLDHPTQ